MQTQIRYSVINQDGRAVIRAVPVRRPVVERAAPPVTTALPARHRSLRGMLRRLRANL